MEHNKITWSQYNQKFTVTIDGTEYKGVSFSNAVDMLCQSGKPFSHNLDTIGSYHSEDNQAAFYVYMRTWGGGNWGNDQYQNLTGPMSEWEARDIVNYIRSNGAAVIK